MNEIIRQRGEESLSMLESETFQGAFKSIDRAIVQRWRDAKSPEERERLHMRQQILAEVQIQLVENVRTASGEMVREGNRDNVFTAFMAKFFQRQE